MTCITAIHLSNAGLQIVRQPFVVGVQECEQLPATQPDAAIPCGTRTAILL
jgi:hypothetical protein